MVVFLVNKFWEFQSVVMLGGEVVVDRKIDDRKITTFFVNRFGKFQDSASLGWG